MSSAELWRASAATYRFAARTFAVEVDEPFYLVLLGLPADQLAGGLVPLDPAGRDRPVDDVLIDLAAEYCRLFIGPQPRCAPYASVQCGHATMGGPMLHTIEAFLRRHDLRSELPAGAPIVANDHVAVAFALLSHLCAVAGGEPTDGRAGGAANAAVAAIQELREHYVLPWVPAFLRSVAAEARLEPYRSVAQLAARLIETNDPAVGGT